MNVYPLTLFFPRTTDADEHFVAYKVHQTKTETLYDTGYTSTSNLLIIMFIYVQERIAPNFIKIGPPEPKITS